MTTHQLLRCEDQLSKDQIQQFRTDGYLAFSDFLDAGQVARCREALSRITAELSGNADSIYSPPGAGKGNQSGASFKRPDSRSMIQFEPGFDPTGKPAAEVDPMVRKFMWFCDEDPVFGEMVSPGGRLRTVVESLLGAPEDHKTAVI